MVEVARWSRSVQSWDRADGSIQVGVGPRDGIVLSRLSAAERRFVATVGGASSPASRAQQARIDRASAHAIRRGAAVERLDAILDVLTEGGFLEVRRRADRGASASHSSERQLSTQLRTDADASWNVHGPAGEAHVCARARRLLVVEGAGPLPERIAAVLRDGGFGSVRQGSIAGDDADMGLRCRADAAPPDLVVLVASGALPAARAEPWRRRGVAHLPVVADPHRVVVGPLVTGQGPCLRCLDLHRADWDPSWPLLLAQSDSELQAPEVTCDSALTAIAAGLVAALARPLLDAGLHLPGVSLEMVLPDPMVVRRKWPVHTSCGCTGAAELRADGAELRADAACASSPGTMGV